MSRVQIIEGAGSRIEGILKPSTTHSQMTSRVMPKIRGTAMFAVRRALALAKRWRTSHSLKAQAASQKTRAKIR